MTEEQRVNSTTVNLVLTVRKAVSLAISVWYYGSGATPGLIAGGAMVLGMLTQSLIALTNTEG
jgi:UDP-xylose/UDP-N-acetylglucosamine transporter B4